MELLQFKHNYLGGTQTEGVGMGQGQSQGAYMKSVMDKIKNEDRTYRSSEGEVFWKTYNNFR